MNGWWVAVVAVCAAILIGVGFQYRGDVIKDLRSELSAMESSVAAARAQMARQSQIIRDHAAYIRTLEGGGNEGLSDYLSDGAGRLWGAE